MTMPCVPAYSNYVYTEERLYHRALHHRHGGGGGGGGGGAGGGAGGGGGGGGAWDGGDRVWDALLVCIALLILAAAKPSDPPPALTDALQNAPGQTGVEVTATSRSEASTFPASRDRVRARPLLSDFQPRSSARCAAAAYCSRPAARELD